jgi:23S rRNA pseudouridine2457 synthase
VLRYFIIYKPFQVLSQFSLTDSLNTGHETKQTLKDYFNVPKDVYPVGRLDYDSEGLLILTNDKKLNDRLLNPAHGHKREYWVQVEGRIDEAALRMLRSGVDISVDGKVHHTANAIAERFEADPQLPSRNPPIRFRKNIPACWIKLIITEGRNRQVRKMTAKAGYPTLRLVRYAIEEITIGHLDQGGMIEMDRQEIYRRLLL